VGHAFVAGVFAPRWLRKEDMLRFLAETYGTMNFIAFGHIFLRGVVFALLLLSAVNTASPR
jgi:hypothetical protein